MSRSDSAFDRRGNRAALLMAEDHDELGAEVLHRILYAAQNRVVHDVPRHPDNKQVAEPLIEQQFRWNSGVGATEDYREGMLLPSISLRRAND